MENGSFQNLQIGSLSNFDFQNHDDHQTHDFNFKNLNQNIKYESKNALENLLINFEELNAKLKLAQKRISSAESEKLELFQESEKLKAQLSTFSEQILVWKAKDSSWTNKIKSYEEENNRLKQQEALFILQQKEVETLNAEISRLQKFYDKVKNQVEPYLLQLKKYSTQLELKIKDQEKQLKNKDLLIAELKDKMVEISSNAREQINNLEIQNSELAEIYRAKENNLNSELERAKEAATYFENKSIKLDSVLDKNTELENENISIKRSYSQEIENLQALLNFEMKKNSEHNARIESLETQIIELNNKTFDTNNANISLNEKNISLETQLENLRFMFEEKLTENGKLQQTLSALEKINLELSAKLSKQRSQNE